MRSRPIELERGMREGRVDAALDWLVPESGPFHEVTLFEDAVVAVARAGHPALRRTRSISELKKGAFISLRPRVEGENPVAGIREWQRLDLDCVLEVSEILEVFMVVRESDLFGLVPRSMIRFAHDVFGLRLLRATPKKTSVPIKLVWHHRGRIQRIHSCANNTQPNDVITRIVISSAGRAGHQATWLRKFCGLPLRQWVPWPVPRRHPCQ
jgi:DNA-binding transcriptional LysR family regulator